MNDSERLDAIGDYGLVVTTHDVYKGNGKWRRFWVCDYGNDERLLGDSIREVIDAAVTAIKLAEGAANED